MAKVTAPSIRARKGGPKIAVVTAYDYPGAVIADRAGVELALQLRLLGTRASRPTPRAAVGHNTGGPSRAAHDFGGPRE